MSVFTEKQPAGRPDDSNAEHRDQHAADGEGLSPDGTDAQVGQQVLAHELDAAHIEELARIRLQHSPYRAIRRVGCSFSDGVLTLSGFVPTYHYKQLAQTAVSEIRGVQKVVNQIDVG